MVTMSSWRSLRFDKNNEFHEEFLCTGLRATYFYHWWSTKGLHDTFSRQQDSTFYGDKDVTEPETWAVADEVCRQECASK